MMRWGMFPIQRRTSFSHRTPITPIAAGRFVGTLEYPHCGPHMLDAMPRYNYSEAKHFILVHLKGQINWGQNHVETIGI